MPELKTVRTNEKTTILEDYKDIILKVDYFWDSHGKLIKWNESVAEPTYWSGVDVQIQKYEFTEHLLNRDFDFEVHQLVVNGKLIAGDVYSHREKTDFTGVTTVTCKVVVGWG
jgi:hypothetical protein